MDEIDKEEANICLLDGCSLPAENGKRYCTKRHYHAAQHKCNNPKKAEAALATWMVLTAAAAVPGADDVRFTEERVVIPYIQIIVIIVLIMVAMVASFLAGITYLRHRDLRGDPGLVRDLQEPRHGGGEHDPTIRVGQFLRGELSDLHPESQWRGAIILNGWTGSTRNS